MIDPHKMYLKSIELAEDYADKDFAAGTLEDALDALKGTLSAKLKSKGESVSIIPALVKSQPEWVEMAGQWRLAKKVALLAKLKYDQSNRYQDNVRTAEATTRQLTK